MPADIKASTTWLNILKPRYAFMGEASANEPSVNGVGGTLRTSSDAARVGICRRCGSAHKPCGGARIPGEQPHTLRRAIISLILPMASAGFSPFGQTSVQFRIVRQRNRRYGS